jgi:hypothetical protein
MNRRLVFAPLIALSVTMAGCEDEIVGSWRLRDRPWTMEMTLESDGTGSYEASNPEYGKGRVDWADRGINGYYLDFVCSTSCEEGGFNWACSFRDDGARLVCEPRPSLLASEEFTFEQE